MDKFKKSQVLVLIILAFLLLITHFLPSSMRPPFLYFIFNLLIISLGAEAGLLSSSASSTPLHENTSPSLIAQKLVIMPHEAISEVKKSSTPEPTEKKVIHVTVTKPSLFFIAREEIEEEQQQEESEGVVNEQEELCAKAEAFIGNFYTQLKMQREESWKKIHYQQTS
ncbi:hypothetical protein K1719_020409 [Acacia pycnantha]|nr:hypothetical protein K1719_020409 [Acacia pycnantha]